MLRGSNAASSQLITFQNQNEFSNRQPLQCSNLFEPLKNNENHIEFVSVQNNEAGKIFEIVQASEPFRVVNNSNPFFKA